MSIRDRLSDLPFHAANGRVKVSNAWYRTVGRRVQGARAGRSNRRNQKARERGHATRRAGAAAWARSKTPIYRDRINPSHGNKHREDARLQRMGNESLARMKQSRAEFAQEYTRQRSGPVLKTPAREPHRRQGRTR